MECRNVIDGGCRMFYYIHVLRGLKVTTHFRMLY